MKSFHLDHSDLIDTYNQEFQNNLLQLENLFYYKKYDEALYVLWNSLSILEFMKDDCKIEALFNYAIHLAPFLHYDEDFLFLLDKFDDTPFKDNPSICSTKHFLKSVIYLNKYNLSEAYAEAQLALKICEESDTVSYTTLCNAQLQVSLLALALKKFDDMDAYIKRFNWYIEQCKNDVEKVFISTLESFKKMVNDTITTEELYWIISTLKNGSTHFYPTFILMHFKLASKEFKDSEQYAIISNGFHENKQYIYPVIDEHFKKYHQFKTRFIKSLPLFMNRIRSLLVYNITKNEDSILLSITVLPTEPIDWKDFILSTTYVNFVMLEYKQNHVIIFVSKQHYLKTLHSLKERFKHFQVHDTIYAINSEKELYDGVEKIINKSCK